MQCQAMYRSDGPPELRAVGETEFANGVAAMAASGTYGETRACAAIIGHADLRLGKRVKEVLEAHLAAGGGRFRGVRCITSWDADSTLVNPLSAGPPRMLADNLSRGVLVLGAARLAFRGMVIPSASAGIGGPGGRLPGDNDRARPLRRDSWDRSLLRKAG